MPAPLAKGVIIAASVLVAAGIAIYESPQVRQWVDQSRRKIAVALHSLGDEIQPRRSVDSSNEFEGRRKQREELVKRNRNDLIRRAKEEGIAVDLDELAKIGREDIELAERRQQRGTANRQASFDDLVGSDGMLKTETGTATGAEGSLNGVRKRGAAGFMAGAAMGNLFADDHMLFDHSHDHESSLAKSSIYAEPKSKESSATLSQDSAVALNAGQLIDLTTSVHTNAEPIKPATSTPSEADEDHNPAQSFYSFTSEDRLQEQQEDHSTGTLTPRSDFTSASVVDSHADDIAVLSMQNDTDHDARSDVFSESGFSELELEGGRDRMGVLTPSSWTDVGSDDESEWGGVGQGGQVSQVQQ